MPASYECSIFSRPHFVSHSIAFLNEGCRPQFRLKISVIIIPCCKTRFLQHIFMVDQRLCIAYIVGMYACLKLTNKRSAQD